ncbi:hypothetical protein [Paenibacillus paeoniae]|uniref:Uncharacterized protein n=1 Tax=Paenibacillus paeoniae TaxID=2292705 RepID=A0A371PFC4_9BACL|nr:hypothetical protein [Paenibacillus paeoniae]REK74208.1 hypothetical protein DX130_16825 [Paenibacillus paeoniae]
MQGFRASINLQFDMYDEELLNRYVLTSSHGEVLRGVMEGVTQNGAHAHLLIGPYGTGKSLLATILCQYLVKSFHSRWDDSLLAQAEQLDGKLAAQLREARNAPTTYLPVIINGRTGSLRNIVNGAIHRTLLSAGIDIETPNEATSVLNTVDRWKRDYPDTYDAFLEHLRGRNWSQSEWSALIANYEEGALGDFIAFYPTVTAGTPWAIEHEVYFLENLERIASELQRRELGLFIVYDEFGRFLQSLDGTDAVVNMRDLQDFAEFVERMDNVQLLVIGHKHIRQYAASEGESVRGEFEKVEKRFRFYSLETDAATYLRLAQEAIAPTNRQLLDLDAIRNLPHQAARFSLFAELTNYQLEQGIVRMLYPLHPVTVMLLPQLSNIFGQNERTLFSFLTDNERYSLADHVHRSDDYYYSDQLFYFFQVESVDDDEQPSLQLYHVIAPYLTGQQLMQRRLVEFLTLWTAGRMTQRQPATLPFIAFALGMSEEAALHSLEELSSSKLVRHNAIRDMWELYDGSSVDIHAVVVSRMATVTLNDRESLALLQRHLPLTYVMPFEYNDEVDMLRYADVKFIMPGELKSASNIEAFTADDRIWLVIYRDGEDIEDPAAVMRELAASYLIAFPSFTAESIRPALLHYKILEGLLHDPVFLAQDARVKNELVYMLHETSLRIRVFVERYFMFEEMEWRSGSERRRIKDLRGLETVVTERLRQTYQSTPIIRNESFNRNRISAIQRRALIDVIDRIIRDPGEDNLGISGYGPNYLIYASALKNNNYSYIMSEGITCNDKLTAVRNELLHRLEQTPVGKLSTLIQMMEEPPYGIRAAVVPLLFVALLRDRWNQLFFYSHDMLTTHLSGSSVLEIVELADAFEYRYYEWTPEEQRQLERISRIFELPTEAGVSFVHTSEMLLKWLRAFPKYTQISKRHTSVAMMVRDHIRSSESDPYSHMKLLAGDEMELAAVRIELESFMDRNANELEQVVLGITGLKSLTEMFQALPGIRREAIGKNSKLLTFDPGDDSTVCIDLLAEHLVGVPRTEWSDATEDLFLGQMKYEWQLLHMQSETAASRADFTAEAPIELSKKSLTVYANVKNMLKYAGKDIAPQEIRGLLLKLLHELDEVPGEGEHS